jgi:hypothetical protein
MVRTILFLIKKKSMNEKNVPIGVYRGMTFGEKYSVNRPREDSLAAV